MGEDKVSVHHGFVVIPDDFRSEGDPNTGQSQDE
jgi:hypothetical protein